MAKTKIGMVMVKVDPDVLAYHRFMFNNCGISLVQVPAQSLRKEAGFKGLKAILFPGGGAELYERDLGKAGIKNLKNFVENGGGYIGICAGSYFAIDNGLMPGKYLKMKGIGIHFLENFKRHPIFKGYKKDEQIKIARINGPMMELNKPAKSLLDYDDEGRFSCVAISQYGKGKVVCFSAHPEGAVGWDGGDYNPYFFVDGKYNKSSLMLENALKWV
ncbi:MAG: BPL-N domain-containing protein [Planctomycetota bacterium]|jgi:glutamine amidotransferase PdxT